MRLHHLAHPLRQYAPGRFFSLAAQPVQRYEVLEAGSQLLHARRRHDLLLKICEFVIAHRHIGSWFFQNGIAQAQHAHANECRIADLPLHKPCEQRFAILDKSSPAAALYRGGDVTKELLRRLRTRQKLSGQNILVGGNGRRLFRERIGASLRRLAVGKLQLGGRFRNTADKKMHIQRLRAFTGYRNGSKRMAQREKQPCACRAGRTEHHRLPGRRAETEQYSTHRAIEPLFQHPL